MHPPRSTPARYSQSFIIVICSLAAWLLGCSRSTPLGPLENGATASGGGQGTAAQASGYGSGSFYPLAIGNTWNYEGGGRLRVISHNGEPGEELTYAFTETHRLIGTTSHEGTAYVVEEQVHHEIPEDPYGPFTWWDRLRQDPQGLFSLDTLLQEPPPLEGNRVVSTAVTPRRDHALRIDVAALSRSGVADASLERFADRVEKLREVARGMLRQADPPLPSGLELKRLVYPLHPGLSWSTRPDFPWPVRVDRMEVLDTPAGKISAFRIDISPFAIPLKDGEWIRVWYSRDGYLGYSIHVFLEGTDGDGEPNGIVYEADDSMRLTSKTIAR